MAHSALLFAVLAASSVISAIADAVEDQAGLLPPDIHRTSHSGTLNASSTLSFLDGIETLYGEASVGCQTCCGAGGQCEQAFQGTPGQCCQAQPAMCCPSGTQCMQGGCRKLGGYGSGGQGGAYGSGGQGGAYGPAPYGAAPYGGQPGYQQGYGGSAEPNAFQKIMRFIRDHMMILFLVLLVLSCLGIGGPCTHDLQNALCGLSLFNMFAPQGMQNELYGPSGGGGGGYGGGGGGYPQAF